MGSDAKRLLAAAEKLSANGFKTLVTQHYPEADSKNGMLDLVLIPD